MKFNPFMKKSSFFDDREAVDQVRHRPFHHLPHQPGCTSLKLQILEQTSEASLWKFPGKINLSHY
ncbi:hypothetical protein MANES_14G043350v8 [Manihot esculenta]|uniref:Uncharacterized protein n=1 Tax=Manihot esculenta TaxID=3983 RepID=A0ACB7GF90_MANES|nr:hypothetical protein MANES_14G043350v8 [Manihot esculenta]